MKFAFFSKPQHKTFNHIPIYYDEREERIKEMEEKAKEGTGEKKGSDYHASIKGSMRRYQQNHTSTANFASSEKKRSNIRIIVILSILFLLAYLLWQHTDTFIEAFLKG